MEVVHKSVPVSGILGSNTLSFEGAGTSDGFGATLDNVCLTQKQKTQ